MWAPAHEAACHHRTAIIVWPSSHGDIIARAHHRVAIIARAHHRTAVIARALARAHVVLSPCCPTMCPAMLMRWRRLLAAPLQSILSQMPCPTAPFHIINAAVDIQATLSVMNIPDLRHRPCLSWVRACLTGQDPAGRRHPHGPHGRLRDLVQAIHRQPKAAPLPSPTACPVGAFTAWRPAGSGTRPRRTWRRPSPI